MLDVGRQMSEILLNERSVPINALKNVRILRAGSRGGPLHGGKLRFEALFRTKCFDEIMNEADDVLFYRRRISRSTRVPSPTRPFDAAASAEGSHPGREEQLSIWHACWTKFNRDTDGIVDATCLGMACPLGSCERVCEAGTQPRLSSNYYRCCKTCMILIQQHQKCMWRRPRL